MPDSETQARTPRIMRLPHPHDPDGRPCLPTHHPRSQPPSPTSPTPTPPPPEHRRPAPAGLPRLCPRPASDPWPPPSAGRHPGHGDRRGPGRARSIAAIAEWATDAPQPVRAALGAHHHAPGHCSVPAEATSRRPLARLAADALAAAVGAWLADRERSGPAVSRRRAVAVDGKTLRGARGPGGDGRPVHLLAAMDHQSRAVLLTQRQVGGAPGRCPRSPRCWRPWTWPVWWSPPTRSRPAPTPPSSRSPPKHALYLL
jgi:hypothetical protein